ncbi:polysaccharide deacetylase family protein [Neobacillus sp. KR4-4]|uniref:polysaccharide deacetylase family protein n=1 Tax=Neobacillus sp. KR4-4 TaxID=3344872 RepID=UPI0035CA3092
MINEVHTSRKAVAITFDDGPNPIYTPQVLEIFSEAAGKATFFMIGDQMKKNPEVVKQVAALGHEIGNHTFTHPKLSLLSTAECLEEIEQNEVLIKELTGRKPVVFRPPYLDYNQDTVSLLMQKGYPMIGAINLEAQDWEQPGVMHILEKSREGIKNGSIFIFHDGYGDRSETIEAVRMLVTELTLQGYQLVTVSELLKWA